MSGRPHPVAAILIAIAPALLGCDALTQFRTEPGQVFSGQVVGSDSSPRKDVPSFIREGFISHTQMDLTFDPFEAKRQIPGPDGTDTPASPGTIDTYTCNTSKRPCPAKQRVPGDFQQTKLEQFVRLNQDALSEYDFPGGGRLRNYMFNARFESTLASATVPRNAMVFLSLMDNGRIEVRVLAPSLVDPATQSDAAPPLFGVFVLERNNP